MFYAGIPLEARCDEPNCTNVFKHVELVLAPGGGLAARVKPEFSAALGKWQIGVSERGQLVTNCPLHHQKVIPVQLGTKPAIVKA